MVEERADTREFSLRRLIAGTELLRTFSIAIDIKNLSMAAAGIITMAIGWWFISVIFYGLATEPKESDPRYELKSYESRFPDKTPTEIKQIRETELKADKDAYQLLERSAGPTGEFRIMPWSEDRGPNPFLTLLGKTDEYTKNGVVDTVLRKQVPVLIEPLVKFLSPIFKLFTPASTTFNRIYFLLIILWTLAVWSFFGGVITRNSAVLLSGRDHPGGLVGAMKYVAKRYLNYFLSPIVPLGLVLGIIIVLTIYSLLHLIPGIGDLLDSVGWLLVIALGMAMALLLVGLISYPLMYPNISVDNGDVSEGFSRSYQFIALYPWHYIWYWLLAIFYGMLLVFFVVLMSSLAVYLGKWAVGLFPNLVNYRQPEFLFVFAPESFGWRDLLLSENSATNSPQALQVYVDSLYFNNKIAAFFVGGLLLHVLFLFVLGFAYSYFWVASTVIYLLMRRKVEDTELDEVYLDDEDPEDPLGPPAPSTPAPTDSTAAPTPKASLPMVEAPAAAPAATPSPAKEPTSAAVPAKEPTLASANVTPLSSSTNPEPLTAAPPPPEPPAPPPPASVVAPDESSAVAQEPAPSLSTPPTSSSVDATDPPTTATASSVDLMPSSAIDVTASANPTVNVTDSTIPAAPTAPSASATDATNATTKPDDEAKAK